MQIFREKLCLLLDAVARAEAREVRRRDAEERLRPPGERGRVEDADGQRDVLRVPERGGRDRVLADAHRGEHLEEGG